MLVSMLLNSGPGIFSDNDEQETKADSKRIQCKIEFKDDEE